MKILILCLYGKNRSRYLAQYLSSKGFETDFDGVNNEDKELIQKKIGASDAIMVVKYDLNDPMLAGFDLNGKKVYEIAVDDRPEKVLPEGKILDGEPWIEFQEKHVYPKLIEQANKALGIE